MFSQYINVLPIFLLLTIMLIATVETTLPPAGALIYFSCRMLYLSLLLRTLENDLFFP